MSALIDLLDQALQANLSKRQWAAFAAILRQTMGFHKSEDDLSPRRLEQLTGIRRNHIWQAKKELERLGLLCSQPGYYGEVLSFSTLGKKGNQAIKTESVESKALRSSVRKPLTSPPIPPPLTSETGQNAPKTGQPYARIGTASGPKQDTTLSNLTTSNHDTVVVTEIVAGTVAEQTPAAVVVGEAEGEAAGLRYPSQLSSSERQQAPACLDGLSPQAAQQVLDVWACKIGNGEVRQSRLGFLVALVKAQRQNRLDTRCLSSPHPRHPAAPPPDDPLSRQQQLARERWLEQQAQQAWLRDMQRFGVALSDLKPPVSCRPGGAS